MDIKELLTDDDAVSQVIGVIVMIAITVILAAVIGTFLLTLDDNLQQQTPQASFSFEYQETDAANSNGNLTITHKGGDSIPCSTISVRGQGIVADSDVAGPQGINSSSHQWPESETNSEGKVITEKSAVVAVSSDYDLLLVYESASGDSSTTLAKDKGPDA